MINTFKAMLYGVLVFLLSLVFLYLFSTITLAIIDIYYKTTGKQGETNGVYKSNKKSKK